MKIEIILPYPGLTTTKGTIFDAQDKETPEDVTGDDTGEQNTGDEQASIITQTESQPTDS